MTTVGTLRRARALILEGWCRGVSHRYRGGRTQFCAWGALLEVGGGPSAGAAEWLLEKTLGGRSLIAWNDSPHRRKRQVVALFDRAIAKAEGK